MKSQIIKDKNVLINLARNMSQINNYIIHLVIQKRAERITDHADIDRDQMTHLRILKSIKENKEMIKNMRNQSLQF